MFYLECPHGFIHTSAYSKVIDSRVLNNSFLVNDEESSQCNPLSDTNPYLLCQSENWNNFKHLA